MEKKINIAKLLKDCPKGMELDCTLFDDVKFEECTEECIYIRLNNGELFALTIYGNCLEFAISKCVIFPKGETTWEGFHRPFKDGDIVATERGLFIGIAKVKNNMQVSAYCSINDYGRFGINSTYGFERLATEEEKAKLFDTIKANGYKWNAETKTLEKLTEQKFDITTLKPLESRVLVRDCNSYEWEGDIFTRYAKSFNNCNFVTLGGQSCKQCIPYNDETKHLLGTIDDCDEYYKTWE